MSYGTDSEQREHARLVLMLMDESLKDQILWFSGQMLEEYPRMPLSRIYHLWEDYRGSSRQPATYSVETGERL